MTSIYQINKASWIEKLAELVNSGKILGISDIRDESDRDGMRIVIELKKDSNSELVISNLYKKTSLQTNFGAIFLALIKGKPIQLSLKKYLNFFLEFREETIRKRTFYVQKNEPTYLNGDKYGNSYHKTCTNALVLYILLNFSLISFFFIRRLFTIFIFFISKNVYFSSKVEPNLLGLYVDKKMNAINNKGILYSFFIYCC